MKMNPQNETNLNSYEEKKKERTEERNRNKETLQMEEPRERGCPKVK